MTTIDLVYFDAGGGHRASAEALRAILQERQPHWNVRLVHLVKVLDPQDSFRRITGITPEDVYNKRLRRGWTLGLAQELKLLQGLIRLGNPTLVKRLQQHWLRTEPDLVVSLIPNFNRALFQSLSTTLPGVPFVTVLTDLADHPPRFWMEPGQSQHFICGTPKAAAQARSLGHAQDCIHETSGMILRPEFYRPIHIDRDAERRRLGLDPGRPTGIVMFGGHGSKAMLGIARQLADTQLILVCGHNHALEKRLLALPASAPRLVLGFCRDVAMHMRLADFFIGKPGPGSLSEALHLGLPVIVTRNAWTMPQERYNTDWIQENGLGIVHKSFGTVRLAVRELLGRFDELRANLGRWDNRALFEVPEILGELLHRSRAVDGVALRSPEVRSRRAAQNA